MRRYSKKLTVAVALPLALALAIGPLAEAGKKSQGQSDRSAKKDSPWLGVEIESIDEDFARRNNLKVDHGVYVEDVIDGSPADDVGLRSGDVILEFNGQRLSSAAVLIDLVSKGESGDEVTLLIDREGRTLTEVATLGSWKRPGIRRYSAFDLEPHPGRGVFEAASDSYVGVRLETIQGQLLKYFGADEGHGALVTEVGEDTPAEKAGLRAGDVIIKVAGEEIVSIDDVQRAVWKADEGESVELTVLRDRREVAFSVTVEDRPERPHGRTFDRIFESFDTPLPDHRDLPRMRGLNRGSFGPGHLYFDMDTQEEDMRQLRRQLQELRRELRDLREELKGK